VLADPRGACAARHDPWDVGHGKIHLRSRNCGEHRRHERAALSAAPDHAWHAIRGDQLTPEVLAAFQTAEIKKWWPVIKAANIKGE
jgi:hypothetical protein